MGIDVNAEHFDWDRDLGLYCNAFNDQDGSSRDAAESAHKLTDILLAQATELDDNDVPPSSRASSFAIELLEELDTEGFERLLLSFNPSHVRAAQHLFAALCAHSVEIIYEQFAFPLSRLLDIFLRDPLRPSSSQSRIDITSDMLRPLFRPLLEEQNNAYVIRSTTRVLQFLLTYSPKLADILIEEGVVEPLFSLIFKHMHPFYHFEEEAMALLICLFKHNPKQAWSRVALNTGLMANFLGIGKQGIASNAALLMSQMLSSQEGQKFLANKQDAECQQYIAKELRNILGSERQPAAVRQAASQLYQRFFLPLPPAGSLRARAAAFTSPANQQPEGVGGALLQLAKA